VIVIDASAALELVLATSDGRRVADIVARSGETLHAPHLIDLEVLQAVRRFARSGQLSDERAAQALADFADLRIQRYGYLALAGRIWELRHNATAYDAAYLALSEALPGILVTRDAALASLPGTHAQVELV